MFVNTFLLDGAWHYLLGLESLQHYFEIDCHLKRKRSQGYFLSASMDAASVYLGLPEAVSIMSPLVPSMMEKGIRNILSVWF